MDIAFVHFLTRCGKDLDFAQSRLHRFGELDLHFVRRTRHRAPHPRLGVLEKGVRFEPAHATQDEEREEHDRSLHFVPPKSGRPKLCGKMSSR